MADEPWIGEFWGEAFKATDRLPDAPGLWHARRADRVVQLEVVRLTLDGGQGTVHDLGLFWRSGPNNYVSLSAASVQWLEPA